MDRSIPFKVLDHFGGWCSLVGAPDLQPELSPLADNVEFFPGGVRTRRGLFYTSRAVGQLNAGPLVHVAGFWCNSPTAGQIGQTVGFNEGGSSVTSLGSIFSVGSLPVYGSIGHPYTASTYRDGATVTGYNFQAVSTQYASRLFAAFNDKQAGWAPGMHTDGAPYRCYPIAPEGPGEGPQMVDSTTPAVVPLATGTRFAICVFLTKFGYLTGASYTQNIAAHTFVSTNNKKMKFVDIPVGPNGSFQIPGVIARKIFVTVAGGDQYAGPYYCIDSKMTIYDNTTTSLDNVEFTETELISGTSFDDPTNNLAQTIPCTWPASVATHRARTIAVAPLNCRDLQEPIEIGSFYTVSNTSFDGGIHVTAGPTYVRYSGWAAPGTGGSILATTVNPGLSGHSLHQPYVITGNNGAGPLGVMANRGQIYNYSTGDTNLDDYGYWVFGRARVRSTAPPTLANFYLKFSSVASSSARTKLTLNKLGTEWTGFAIRFSDTVNARVTPEISLVSTSGSITTDVIVEIDDFHLVPHGEFFRKNTLLISRNGAPEAFDALTGVVTISQGIGQVRTPFSIRDNLFVPKDRSLWSVQDNGGEPFEWSVTPVSDTIGTQSYLGSSTGDGFAVLAGHDGAFVFDGGAPSKISQEIRLNWDNFDKTYANTYQVSVDDVEKKIYFLIYNNLSVREIWVMDYVEGLGDPVANNGSGRKWSRWYSYKSDDALLTLTAVGRTYVGASTGLMSVLGTNQDTVSAMFLFFYYDQWAAAATPAPIRSIYETGCFGGDVGRSLFSHVLMRIGHPSAGAPTTLPFGWYIKRPDNSTVTQQVGTTSNISTTEFESPIKHTANQQDLFLRIGITAGGVLAGAAHTAGEAFSINRLGVSFKPAPNAPIKGHN